LRLGQLLPVLCSSESARARYADFEGLEIAAIVNDSRQAAAGCMFVALHGAKSDGHKFIPNAVRAGAVAVVSERRVPVCEGAVHFILPDAREKLAGLAAVFYGHPSRALHVTGITGTNGKTTTSYRLRSILEASGRPAGLVGTIAYKIGERSVPANNTTPDGLLIQDLFAQMVAAGLTHAAVEVSSHALDQRRVCDVDFRTAVFTGLSDHEHLDYHRTFERYRDAKAMLFEMLRPGATAVINADDPEGRYMAERARCMKLWFGLRGEADVSAEITAMDMTGTAYRLKTPRGTAEVRSSFAGEFNVMNDLAAAAAALAADVELDAIAAGLEQTAPVPGRLQRIPAPDFHALVDYAHNEGALESVLGAIRALAPRRLLIVFGAGGDRDDTKRPLMGVVAEKYCDRIFITADNSRSEDTLQIIHDIERDMTGARPTLVIPGREMAIRAAVDAAEPGDVLLVAGKGHETYQILGQITSPFDDREVLRRAIAEREVSMQRVTQSEA